MNADCGSDVGRGEYLIDVNALAAIGSKRLATLLAEATMTNPCKRRRLQFELSAQKHENLAEAVVQWMRELSEHRSLLDAKQIDELARELEPGDDG